MTHHKGLFLAGAGLIALAGGAQAQTGPTDLNADTAAAAAQSDSVGPNSTVPSSGIGAESDPGRLGDIIVTARRREENIQTVPVSITALGAEALVSRGVQQTTDLQRIVPGVIFIGAGSDANTSFAIRGQGKDVSGPGLPSVISYFNEVPLPSWGSVLPAFDVSSVQVLKGPQGTLFGRNTTGGAVLVYSAPATYDLEGYVQGTYGRYNWRGVQGAVNIPIVDERISLRLAGEVVKRRGFVEEQLVGGDANDLNSRAFRITLRVDLSDSISNVTVYDYFRKNTNGDGYVSVGDAGDLAFYRSPGLAAFYDCGTYSAFCQDVDVLNELQKQAGYRKSFSNIDGHDKTKLWGVSNTTTIDLGPVTIKNIFGYRDTKVDQQFNTDGVPIFLLDTRGFRFDRQISNELQFSGTAFGDRLNWLFGGFYLDVKPTGASAFAIDAFDFLGNPDANPFAGISNNLFSDRSKAVFGNLTFAVTDRLKLNGGLRRTWDREAVCAAFTQPFFGEPIRSLDECRENPFHYENSAKFAAWTYTVGADYQLSDQVFTYVTVRRGYRAGNINAPRLAGPLAPFQFFGPQTVDDVEIGAKTQWNVGDIRGRFNIAAFRGKFKGLQRYIGGIPANTDGDNNPATDPTNTALVLNAGESKVQGVEIDALIAPTRNFSLNGSLSYLDAKYTDLQLPPVFAGLAGSSPYERAPKWSYTVAGRYEIPFEGTDSSMIFNLDYYHVGSYFVQLAQVPSYGLLNGSIEFTNIANVPLSATLFMTNITDKVYLRNSNLIGPQPGNFSFAPGEPRMYGIRLRHSF
jgi:iron complex outermembrane receptor protein